MEENNRSQRDLFSDYFQRHRFLCFHKIVDRDVAICTKRTLYVLCAFRSYRVVICLLPRGLFHFVKCVLNHFRSIDRSPISTIRTNKTVAVCKYFCFRRLSFAVCIEISNVQKDHLTRGIDMHSDMGLDTFHVC